MKISLKLILLLLSGAGLLASCGREDNLGPLAVSVATDLTCKGGSMLKTGDPAVESSCIQYAYDGDSILVIKHVNAGFNCCPEAFAVDIEIKGDSLIIREDDVKQLCKCNCLYDLEITVHNLPEDTYHVRIVEPYVREGVQRLVFDLDLKNHPEGEQCVTRPLGWWR